MNRYFYDLHIHSCLSPCADDDMTVNNIAGMASVCGLNIIALTDHNTTRNCRPFFAACKKYGIVPVPGVEITTAEEIHVVALFDSLENAEEYEKVLKKHRMKIENRTDIFGNQFVLDEDDNVIDTEPYMLSAATDMPLEEAVASAREHGAFVYPAHIDRMSNGIVAVLGSLPDEPRFSAVEIHDREKLEPLKQLMPSLACKRIVFSSDAHTLGALNGANNSFLLDDEPYSSAKVRSALLALLDVK